MEKQQKEPASTRVPTELRLEIWKHYFATLPFLLATRYEELPYATKRPIPPWTQISVFAKGIKVYALDVIRPLPGLDQAEPALLQVCPLFRAEALPLYLQYLQREESLE